MGANTKIEWCDFTFNCWRGCTKVSAGCANCYADTLSRRNPGTLGVWGPNGTRVVASENMWREPLKWDRAAARAGTRAKVFCASLGDVFEDWTGLMVGPDGEPRYQRDGKFVADEIGFGDVPSPGESGIGMNTVRSRLFTLIDATPNLDWLLLTKRPENALRMTYDAWCKKIPGHVSQNEGDGRRWAWPSNVWMGVSVEDRATKSRADILRTIPARVRFLSCEPLIEDLGKLDLTGINWLICGGESGPGARPCRVEWIRSIVEQCQAAGVPCFVKQLGAKPVQFGKCDCGRYEHGRCHQLCPSIDPQPLSLRDPKGGDITEFPPDLRVREWPEVRADR